nr:MAG TPA: hypothetical protein [Caudoviricetes sp.]
MSGATVGGFVSDDGPEPRPDYDPEAIGTASDCLWGGRGSKSREGWRLSTATPVKNTHIQNLKII